MAESKVSTIEPRVMVVTKVFMLQIFFNIANAQICAKECLGSFPTTYLY